MSDVNEMEMMSPGAALMLKVSISPLVLISPLKTGENLLIVGSAVGERLEGCEIEPPRIVFWNNILKFFLYT